MKQGVYLFNLICVILVNAHYKVPPPKLEEEPDKYNNYFPLKQFFFISTNHLTLKEDLFRFFIIILGYKKM